MRFKDQKPFYRTKLERDEKRKVYTVSLNLEEQANLIEDMKVLQQPKEGTALKMLWKVGREVLHDPKTGRIIDLIFNNLRKNERQGIKEVSTELPSPSANVTQKEEEL